MSENEEKLFESACGYLYPFKVIVFRYLLFSGQRKKEILAFLFENYYISPVIIAGCDKKYPVILAPMAGWTDFVYREVCKKYGADIIYTEMASADALIRDHKKTFEIVRFSQQQRPVGIQLFGADAEILAAATDIVNDLQPDFIDLNMGCPAKKVVKRGGGSALLQDLVKLGRIAAAVVKKSRVPVSAKIRSGWSQNNAVSIAKILASSGVAFIAIHPRTQKQQFKGSADWRVIKDVKDAVNIPVIGNGDIQSVNDAERMLETGCDAVMAGRATRGRPWIFSHIKRYFKDGTLLDEPPDNNKIEICLDHIERLVDFFGERRGLLLARKHISWYVKGIPNASTIRQKVFSLKEYKFVKEELLTLQCSMQKHFATAVY
ncbi:tRNA dihydrouridine synthase DusB [candidate division KSB1 bacterium]|nr:tRNA dihydrouridine synthase DusB [candidate division KSB1 bacterium]